MRLPAEIVAQLRGRFEGQRVCVTGGAGFIGGHVLDALLSLGASVVVIDDLATSTAEHVASLIDLEPDRVRFIHGSILEPSALSEAVAGCSHVIHLAALGSVPRSIKQPERTIAVNTTGTVRVLAAARAADVSRVVLASSSSVYGESETLPKHERMPTQPLSPYAASKASAETFACAWSRAFGLSTACLRFFNVFGPRQSAEAEYAAVIPAFAKAILDGNAPTIFGDGEQSRDFTYVDNAVLGVLRAAATPTPLVGEPLNIAAGEQLTVNDLAKHMAELLGVPALTPTHVDARPGDVKHSKASLERAGELIGYVPITSTTDGLAETCTYFAERYNGAGAGSA
ncbi:MAG: SDR family NAD(P)-dependent oxidoreductase [Planctomycetota bacterium]